MTTAEHCETFWTLKPGLKWEAFAIPSRTREKRLIFFLHSAVDIHVPDIFYLLHLSGLQSFASVCFCRLKLLQLLQIKGQKVKQHPLNAEHRVHIDVTLIKVFEAIFNSIAFIGRASWC